MNRIEEIRKTRGLTRLEVARRTGIDPATLYKIERGHIRLYPSWKRRLAEALEVPEEELEGQ